MAQRGLYVKFHPLVNLRNETQLTLWLSLALSDCPESDFCLTAVPFVDNTSTCTYCFSFNFSSFPRLSPTVCPLYAVCARYFQSFDALPGNLLKSRHLCLRWNVRRKDVQRRWYEFQFIKQISPDELPTIHKTILYFVKIADVRNFLKMLVIFYFAKYIIFKKKKQKKKRRENKKPRSPDRDERKQKKLKERFDRSILNDIRQK